MIHTVPTDPDRRTAIFGLRTAARALTVLALTGPAVAAAASAHATATSIPYAADAPGRVCMFLAPEHVFGLGHVGWAYRETDGATWEFGATSGADSSWHKSGPFTEVLTGFRNGGDSSGPYRTYRCKDTVGHDDVRAAAKVDQLEAEQYDIFTNNCLTRSLEVFQAYDDSGGLAALGAGRLTAPRWYFDNDLAGFETATEL